MTRFHINPETGNPGSCSARRDNCPFGSTEAHFPTAASARAAYEATQARAQEDTQVALSEWHGFALAMANSPSEEAVIWGNLAAEVKSLIGGSLPVRDVQLRIIDIMGDESTTAAGSLNPLLDKLAELS